MGVSGDLLGSLPFDSELLSHYREFDSIKSIYVLNSQGISGIIYGVEI